jgi:hypothetical protein
MEHKSFRILPALSIVIALILATFNLSPAQAAIGNALSFDGANDYVLVSSPFTAFTNQITVEAWVYFDGGSDGIWMEQSVANVDNMASNVWIWHANGANGMTWYVNNGGGWLSLNMTAVTTGWHHIATVASNAGLQIYVDGTLNNSNGSSLTALRNAPTAIITLGTDSRYIGQAGRIASQIMDDVRIWNVARSQAQIAANMNTQIPAQAGLVAYYKLDEGVANGNNPGVTTAYDSAGSGRNGTLNNFTLTGTSSNWVGGVNLQVSPDASGGNGPGGVGAASSTGNLVLWLRADRGVFTDTVCTTPAGNSDTVRCWQDQSGNGLHANNTASAPSFVTGAQNGQPALSFVNNYLQTGALGSLAKPFPTDQSTGFVVSMADNNAQSSVLFHTSDIGAANRFMYIVPWSNVTYFDHGANSATGRIQVGSFNSAGTFVAWDFWGRQPAPNVGQVIYKNGNSQISDANAAIYNPAGATYSTIGSATWPYSGDIAELILFNASLNSVERILVDNYLSAKFNLPLDTSGGNTVDIYDGDLNDANHNFDRDMAGIGRYGGNSHTQAFSAGIIVVNRSFLKEDGDWLTFSHQTPLNDKTTADLPSGGGWGANSRRWSRYWYFQRSETTVNGGLVDIIFDFSEGNMNGGQPPAGPASNYRLLKRANPGDQFTDIATASAIVGDQVQFLGVDVTLLGSNFTLGTLNDNTSPTAIQLDSLSVSSAHGPALWSWLLFGAAGLLLGLAGAFVLRRN